MAKSSPRPSPAETRALENFIRRVRSATDTPSLLQLLAGDGELLLQCRRLVKGFSDNQAPLLEIFAKICRRQGLNPESVHGQLELAARALGLSAPSGPQVDYYRYIGVDPSASAADIQHAYRRRAKALHPDAHPQEVQDSRDFIQLQEAYRTLSDPDLRRYYDQSRAESAAWCEPPACEYRQAPLKKRRLKKHSLFQLALVILGLLAVSFVFNAVYELRSISDGGYNGSHADNALQDKALTPAAGGKPTNSRESGSQPSQSAKAMPVMHQDQTAKTAQGLAPLPDFPDFPAQPAIMDPGRADTSRKQGPHHVPAAAAAPQKSEKAPPKLLDMTPGQKSPDRQALETASQAKAGMQNTPPKAGARASTAPAKPAGIGRAAKSERPLPSAGTHNPGMDAETDHLLETLAKSAAPARRATQRSQDSAAGQTMASSTAYAGHLASEPKITITAEQSADEITRIKSFIDAFSRSYESRDFNRFAKYFAPGASQDGKPFSKSALVYRRNFELIRKLSFKVQLNRFSQLIDEGIVRTRGSYEMKWLPYGGKWQESHGEIAFELVRSGDSYKVKGLEYP